MLNEQKTTNEGVPESCEECPRLEDVTQQRLRLARLLGTVSTGLEGQLENNEIRPSVADYLKLLQMGKEFEEDLQQTGPREIRATWVDPDPESNPDQ